MRNSILKTALLVLTAALLAAAMLTGCATNAPGSSANADVTELGEGSSGFRFEVTDSDGGVKKYDISTDEKTVGTALIELGIIEGEDSEYGFYVTAVNGTKADFNTDNAYWAFYIDGEYATSGVDSTDIEPDKIYAFVYTKA